jgi:adenine phosphoribosyltransferase
MATLDELKSSLRQKAAATSSLRQPLSEAQYRDGFDLLTRGPGCATYQDFIIPRLAEVLQPLFAARIRVSVLEIGPGPRTVLGYLPRHLRRKIGTYTALEPNGLFATQLRGWIASSSPTATSSSSSTLPEVGLAEEKESRLPCLESAPDIRNVPFVAQAMETEWDGSTTTATTTTSGLDDHDRKFDLVLFCHSLYGVYPKTAAVRRAIEMLVDLPRDGLVVVFHRHPLDHVVDDDDGLVCHRTATFPTGVVSVPDAGDDNDDDKAALDAFAAFVAGFTTADETTRAAWRGECRALGRRGRLSRGGEPAAPATAAALVFAAPETMMAFTRAATTALPELAQAGVPLVLGYGNQPPPLLRTVKNREARVCRPAAIARPTDVGGVQACVRWALRHGVGLTVVGGGHSGHCLRPGVVAVDMGAFDRVSVVADGHLVWAGAGCTSGDIVRAAMAAGLTVPLGARPSVGAGLVLQGGIGHLARGYGLACDAIVGAVVVSVASGEVLRVGQVPSQHLPVGAVQCEEEDDLLWALRGAGTNFGIVVGLALKACAAQTYAVRSWVVPLRNRSDDGRQKLHTFDKLVASVLPQTCSSDAYLYGSGDGDGLCLGVTLFETSSAGADSHHASAHTSVLAAVLGPETSVQRVDDIGVFETDMYMSGMHGGHGGGKTSSFKRCVFLKDIGEAPIADVLVAAVATRPTPLCYLHLLHGGGAIRDVAADATAFGCRDWDFACVVTGVWPRDQDGTEAARAAVGWVYRVVSELLPLTNISSSGVYGADLGPDPRDAPLAVRAFGPNGMRLGRLKQCLDPRNMLAHACPLPRPPREPKLIVLVTGDHGAGKDYCADVWVSVLTNQGLSARAISISEATKREYAATTGANLEHLLRDRDYKEAHRPALTAFFQSQVQQRPRLPDEHFLYGVRNAAADADVLLITGMRDEAPVPSLAYQVPRSGLLEVRVEASQETRWMRRRNWDTGRDRGSNEDEGGHHPKSDSPPSDHRPCLVFHNDTDGHEVVQGFAERYLVPFFHEDRQRLARMVRRIPDFPREGIEFRHVLDIAQQPGGLALCTSLLRGHFAGNWAEVDVVVGCEAGGFVYASALAALVNVRLALVRQAGKLPPPTFSVERCSSHILSTAFRATTQRMEMERDVIPRGAYVLVVDDVLATGQTLLAVLRLLDEAGVGAKSVAVLVVAEFPFHQGRKLLRQHGFGKVSVQNLLVFGGA